MALIHLHMTCERCNGEGIVPTGGLIPGEPSTCPRCLGEKHIEVGSIEGIDDALQDLDDKLNDIITKCNDIKEVVDGL